MTDHAAFDYRDFQCWQRPIEIDFWLLLLTLHATFNSVTSAMDHPGVLAWQPWSWEWSSALARLALLPAAIAAERRWPFRFDTWPRSLSWYLLACVPFSLVHVGGMILLRKLAYAAAGLHYDFGPWWINAGYEYLKDVRTYFSIIAILTLYRLWLLRLQGEVRLLAAPDEGAPAEPPERPERFLVRKLSRVPAQRARDRVAAGLGQLREPASARP